MSVSALFSNPEPVFPQKTSLRSLFQTTAITITNATNGVDVLSNLPANYFDIPDNSNKIRLTYSIFFVRTSGTITLVGLADGISDSTNTITQNGLIFDSPGGFFNYQSTLTAGGNVVLTSSFSDIITVANRNVAYRPQLFMKVITGDASVQGGIEVVVSVDSIV